MARGPTLRAVTQYWITLGLGRGRRSLTEAKSTRFSSLPDKIKKIVTLPFLYGKHLEPLTE
jgi:hypothetical protein